jgi:hypothetical protein
MSRERILDKGTIPFQAEGRLLQELGERLVASPDVALVELPSVPMMLRHLPPGKLM